MPPKRKDSPEDAIVSLLEEKNRPYSSITLEAELHNDIKQTQLKKILDQLVNDGRISCKNSGKMKLYFANQEDLQVASPEELEQIDNRIEGLKETATGLGNTLEELRAQRNRLLKMKPIDQLRQYRVDIEENVQKESARKEELIKFSEGISPDDAVNFQKQFDLRCGQWKSRKNKCKEIIDQICEGMGKKPSELYEELDLETDENFGLKLEYKDKKYTIIENVPS